MAGKHDIIVNVECTPEEEQRILAEEATWTAPKLVILCAVTLAVSFTTLWFMAHSTQEVSFPQSWWP